MPRDNLWGWGHRITNLIFQNDRTAPSMPHAVMLLTAGSVDHIIVWNPAWWFCPGLYHKGVLIPKPRNISISINFKFLKNGHAMARL